jgi:2-desacetyl-2-hydroxyethyl bacteriochlorophyllide A dehydrogenase
MKAISLEEPGRFAVHESEAPAPPGDGEALVGVRRIGVCGTDIHAFRGKQPLFSYPRILGHELGVEVLSVGANVSNVRAGDRCSVEPYLNCGTCIACRRGKPNCCSVLRVLGVHADGGMREQFVLPAAKLHSSPTLTLDQLALVETLGIGCHAINRSGIEAGEFALVIGAGPIGLATMQFAVQAGARVIAMDVDQARLDFCRDRLRVSHTVNAATQVALDELKAVTDGDLPTIVFDATGNPRSMNSAFDYPAQGGRIVFVGLFQGDVAFNDPNFHRRELTVMGSRNALPADFTRIIGLVEAGGIDTTPWITHRASFTEVPSVFPLWTKPESGVIKAMIEV